MPASEIKAASVHYRPWPLDSRYDFVYLQWSPPLLKNASPRGVYYNKYGIRQNSKATIYDPSLDHKGGGGGGRGVKLTSYLDSPHILSQYLLIRSEAVKATIEEI